MLMLTIPDCENLELGAKVRINGTPTVVKRERGYLVYTDDEDKVNRCRIVDESPAGELLLPDGHRAECTTYFCDSDGGGGIHVILPTIIG